MKNGTPASPRSNVALNVIIDGLNTKQIHTIKATLFFLFLMLFSGLAQLLGQTHEVDEISQREIEKCSKNTVLYRFFFRSANAKWEPQKDKNLKHISDVFHLIYCAKCNPN